MEFQSQISLDLLSNSTKILENLCCENKKTRKHTLPKTLWQAINIRLKTRQGQSCNLVKSWALSLLKPNRLLRASLSINVKRCALIDYYLKMWTVDLARW